MKARQHELTQQETKTVKASELKGQTIAFAGSGGLDSCTITRWLTNLGVRVVSMTVDLGQPDEPNLEAVRQRMLKAGAEEAIVIDGARLPGPRRPPRDSGPSQIRRRVLEHYGHRALCHDGPDPCGDAQTRHPRREPRRHRPRERPGALSARHEHARAGFPGLRPLARQRVSGRLRRTEGNDRVLSGQRGRGEALARQALQHRRQFHRVDSRGRQTGVAGGRRLGRRARVWRHTRQSAGQNRVV